MLVYPEIDSVIFSIGPVSLHWYGFMYFISFILGSYYLVYQSKKNDFWNPELVNSFFIYVVLGVILGGRIGYVLFYDFGNFISNPMIVFQIWNGGMSFHGGFLGVSLAGILFARLKGVSPFTIMDFAALAIPIGLFFGRIGNFINSELWGKVTDSSLGMLVYDPVIGEKVTKYPSQLFEAFLEGIVLFVVLFILNKKVRPLGFLSAVFIIGYGLSRFLVEFVRVPDAQLGYLAFGWLTMGQILTIPMIVGGLWVWYYSYLKPTALAKFLTKTKVAKPARSQSNAQAKNSKKKRK